MAFAVGRRGFTTFVSRALASKSSPSSSSISRTRFALAAFSQQPQSRPPMLFPNSASLPIRSMSTEGGAPVNGPSPNTAKRPPDESILLDGCDFEHWLIILEFPDPKPSRDEMIDAYVKILAKVVGSEEEAKKRIYSVSTTTYTGFGCRISEELSNKFKEYPEALWVLPDTYLDVPNKDYGGDLYIDGKVIRRPQFDFTDTPDNQRRNRPSNDRRHEPMPMRGERRPPPQQNRPQAPSTEAGYGRREPMQGERRPPPQQNGPQAPSMGADYGHREPMQGERRPPPEQNRPQAPSTEADYGRREPMQGERRPPPEQNRPQAPSTEGDNKSQGEAGGSPGIW